MSAHHNVYKDQLSFQLSNGRFLPALGLGTWKSQEGGEVASSVKEAIKCGYRHLDCAYIYGNQKEIGRALQECFQEGLCTRDELFVTSKLWNDAHHPNDVMAALNETLQELQLDYLDMYLIHWPVCLKKGTGIPQSADDFVPLSEIPIVKTWQAMEECVDENKTRGIGVSNFSVLKLEALMQVARIPPAVNQVERHPYLAQPALVDYCKSKHILVTNYAPLGRPARVNPDGSSSMPALLEDDVVAGIAKKHDVTPAQVLLQWAIATGTSAIPKSVRPHRLAENLASLKVKLDDEDMGALKALDRHRRYVDGGFWCMPGNTYTIENLWDESTGK